MKQTKKNQTKKQTAEVKPTEVKPTEVKPTESNAVFTAEELEAIKAQGSGNDYKGTHERMPHAVSQTNGNPFEPGSHMRAAFDMAMRGTTRREIIEYAKANGIGAPRLFTYIAAGAKRSEGWHGFRWEYRQTADGRIVAWDLRSVVSPVLQADGPGGKATGERESK